MQLNIYLISHPIIQKLVSDLLYHNYDAEKNNHYYEELGFLIIYEVLRKYITIKKIYIKKITHTQEINIKDKQRKYIILTDLTKSYKIITRASSLLPEMQIEQTSFNKKHNNSKNIESYIQKLTNKSVYILLIELHLNNYSITYILDKLVNDKLNNIDKILIVCITCNNKILERLGHKYKNLHIYTTKIIYS